MSDSTTTPPTALFAKVFLDHPATVNESYFGHMRFAFAFAFWLFVAACAAFIHALIPALCETTASRILTRLHNRIMTRH
ncbi:hypothetical protein SAMN04488515_2544 [Cognatiyoonia koreensis]|uniref:Capsule biosynthesis protein n=1 Tax=Cognatiyoonia koreensis TaxID=364200 RepID=A0A1I0RFL0_9RHOB|nr:DUF6356 family protein [Cognatiyoonia koreensis]SEW39030.1 hypothetical protein SAMN04488515_2544 [Cognatiyoonia koreensis]